MRVNPIQPFLTRQGFVMLDGGLATEMEKRGADLNDELWSARMLIESPEMIRQVHADFLKAGADVIATASYQASFGGFQRVGYGRDQAESLLRLSVELAVLARDEYWASESNRQGRIRPLVAASIGPYGASLHDGSEYHGNYGVDRQELLEFHQSRLEVLTDTEADLFAFETIPSQLEAEVLQEVLWEFPNKSAWMSFSCKNGQQVSHSESLADCAKLADQAEQVVAIGVNCTKPGFISDLLESIVPTSTPLVVYPNSGETWQPKGNQWAGKTCEFFPVLDWYDRGARLFGGCCRTSMGAIAHMRSDLTRYLDR